MVVYDTCTLDVLQDKIVQFSQKHKVNRKNIIVDADGI